MAVAQKRELHFRRVKRKLISSDPQRKAILYRIRSIYRHLPRNGILLFFDVQPIAVKAYGGCRYTAEEKLVLESKQKTRGLFYLFLIYEVNSGRVRWAFLPNKNSKSVCRFMRQVRRWYPKQKVCIA